MNGGEKSIVYEISEWVQVLMKATPDKYQSCVILMCGVL